MTSVTDTGTGDVTATIATDFSAAEWCGTVSVDRTYAATKVVANDRKAYIDTQAAAGSAIITCLDSTAVTMVSKDPFYYFFAGFGDQA